MIHRSTLVLSAVLGSLAPWAAAARPAQGSPLQAVPVPGSERAFGLALPLQIVAYGEDPSSLNETGTAMEVVGNYLFVGAPGDAGGRVDVWYRLPSGYFLAQQLRLPASIAGQDDRFGRSLAADGGVLVVGTRSGNESGRAVVYRRAPNGLYAFERVLAPAGGAAPLGFFGERMAVLEDELLVVAARGELAVHVFEALSDGTFPSASTHVLDQVNTATTPAKSWMTGFGTNVGLHRAGTGEVRILVGMEDACFYQRTQLPAPDETTPDPSGATAARTGGVAVLREVGGAWRLDQRLIPEWSKTKNFGFEVEVEGSQVAIGAIYSRIFSNGLDAGSASVYRWSGSGFQLVETVLPSIPFQNGWFGYSLELCGSHLLVGQPFLWGGPQGLVEVFEIRGSDVVQVMLITAPDGNPAAGPSALGDCFGREIVCNAFGEVLVAAPFSAPASGTPQYGGGALYLYR